MAERKASSALYLSKTVAGLAAEIGEWADGTTDFGPFVACSHENLSIVRMSWKQWLVAEASRAIVPDGSCDLSLKIGPLPAARTALPLPRSLYLEISSADRTSPNLGFVEESLIPLHRCFATRLKMRHNASSA